MKIQIKSDLHTEFNKGNHEGREKHYINPEADAIVLAGDIAVRDSEVEAIDKIYGNCGKPIFYIPGNHEYYHNDFNKRDDQLKTLLSMSAVRMFNPGLEVFKDVLFIGATMWTDLSDPLYAMRGQMCMTDFNNSVVRGGAPYKWTERHIKEKKFVEDALLNPKYKDLKKVVITHFLPIDKSVSSYYKNDPLNCCYVSGCNEFFGGEWSPDLWIHGHTHDSCDYKEGKTRVVCNPYGYDPNGLNEEWKNDLVVEI